MSDKFQFIVEIDFVSTPHQSPSVTASPEGEAFNFAFIEEMRPKAFSLQGYYFGKRFCRNVPQFCELLKVANDTPCHLTDEV